MIVDIDAKGAYDVNRMGQNELGRSYASLLTKKSQNKLQSSHVPVLLIVNIRGVV